MTTPHEIAAWLQTLPGIHDVTPCSIGIKGTVYPAAHYTSDFTTDPSSEAYRRGERVYSQTRIYVVGMLPAVKRNGNVAFRFTGASRDWYVASYSGHVHARKQEVAESSEYHPFGNSFILAPWDIAANTIDQFERVPYKRVTVDIQEWSV